jgi:hypothetical protein
VKFLLKHGADAQKKNRDSMLPIDLCKEEDIADLLQGSSALLDAAKKGNLAKLKKLLSPENIVSLTLIISTTKLCFIDKLIEFIKITCRHVETLMGEIPLVCIWRLDIIIWKLLNVFWKRLPIGMWKLLTKLTEVD